jgi:2-octaprenyl-6-methoxyphenol hydroxylase
MTPDFDLIIVGGGLVGGSLALALRGTPLKIAVIEAQTDAERAQAATGDRALALSRNTVQALRGLGVFEAVENQAAPIRRIHISDRGHFGKARLEAKDRGVDALGHVVVARGLEQSIAEAMAEEKAITAFQPARILSLKAGPESILVSLRSGNQDRVISARLAVAADGGNSTVRSLLSIPQAVKDYQQTAVVTEVTTSKDHQGTAFERFTRSGPLALLPLGPKRCSVVWTLNSEDAEDVLREGESEFVAQLQDAFGHWLGTLTLARKPQGFPLKLIRAEQMTDDRVILIGNAMHTIHPVAGQGFNLGLRDAAVLAERIAARHRLGEDIGDAGFLAQYAAARKSDLATVIRFTDSLIRIFSNELPPLVALRNLALLTFDRLPFAKRLLARRAMGYGSSR